MIADRIKVLRENNNYTQTQLAKKLSITRSSVNAWEMGISVPSTQYIIELANIFGVTTDYLLGVSLDNIININSLTDEQTRIIYSLVNHFHKENKRSTEV